MALAAHDLADGLAREAGRARYRLERNALRRQRQNLRVDRLACHRGHPLDPLGLAQSRWIDGRFGRERLAQPGQFGPNRGQEGGGGVLEQMPAVGHLPRLGCRLRSRRAIAGAAVPADDPNLPVLLQPGHDRVALPIRQDVDDRAPFQIDDDSAVAVAAPPREVVDADHRRRGSRAGSGSLATNGPQQGVLRPRRRKSCHHPGARPPAKCQPDGVQQSIAACDAPAVTPPEARRQGLAERLAPAEC